MSTKPKDILILYLALALIAGVFYYTVKRKNKVHVKAMFENIKK